MGSGEGNAENSPKNPRRRAFLKTLANAAAAGAVTYTAVSGPLVGKLARPDKPLRPIESFNPHPAISLKIHRLQKMSPDELKKFWVKVEYQSAHLSENWKRPSIAVTEMGEKLPLQYHIPTHPVSDVPVTMVKGWTGDADQWKGTVRQFLAHGRAALVCDTTHGIDYSRALQEHVDRATDRATHIEYRKVAAVIAALDAKQITKTDAVAHSEGSIDLVMAALSYPERFRTVVLVNPAGLLGDDGFWRMVFRNQFEDLPSMRAAKGARMRGDQEQTFSTHTDDPYDIDTFAKQFSSLRDIPYNASHTILEAFSIAWIQIAELLRELKAKGVDVVIVASNEDKMFPAGRMIGEPRKDAEGNVLLNEEGKVVLEKPGVLTSQIRADEPDSSKIFDQFILTTGIHVRWFDQPVEYTWLVNDALTERAAARGEH